MIARQILLAAGLGLMAVPAAADCTDRIAYLEGALDDAARVAISASSGGQGVAGAREAQAMAETQAQAEAQAEAGAAGDAQPGAGAPTGVEPTGVEPAEAAPGSAAEGVTEEARTVAQDPAPSDPGEALIEARALLGEARTLSEDGDEEACLGRTHEILVDLIRP